MRIWITITILSFALACNFRFTDMQDIPIQIYTENSKNIELGKAIISYDVNDVLADSLGELYEIFTQNTQLGLFVRSSDNQPSIRLTYEISDSRMRDNLEYIKTKIENLYRKLIAIHISKEAEFTEARKFADQWIEQLKNKEYNKCWDESSGFLKSMVERNAFDEMLEKVAEMIQNSQSFLPTHSQFYSTISGIPDGEYFTIFYNMKNSEYSELPLSLGLEKLGENEFMVTGIYIHDGIR